MRKAPCCKENLCLERFDMKVKNAAKSLMRREGRERCLYPAARSELPSLKENPKPMSADVYIFNTLPVFSTTFQVMGLIQTACTKWQWSVSVLEKSSVPQKHLFCYFIWLCSILLWAASGHWGDTCLQQRLQPLTPRCSHMGCSRGRVTWCHHSGGRCPSLRAGGKASVLGPPGGVSSCNCLI